MRIIERFSDTPEQYKKKALVIDARRELVEAAAKVTHAEEASHWRLSPGERAQVNRLQLQEVVEEYPSVKAYFDQGGRVELSRHGVGLPKSRIIYDKDGLMLTHPRADYEHTRIADPARAASFHLQPEGGYSLDPQDLWEFAEKNRAIERFANLTPKGLIKRMARRIDPKSIK